MIRAAAALAMLAATSVAGVAIAAPDMPIVRAVASPQMGRGVPDQPALMRLWSTVGKCVVQRDRAGSMAFVRAAVGSDEAANAQRRLDPVFAGCLAGSRVPGPSSIVLRRAAVVEALGLARGVSDSSEGVV